MIMKSPIPKAYMLEKINSNQSKIGSKKNNPIIIIITPIQPILEVSSLD